MREAPRTVPFDGPMPSLESMPPCPPSAGRAPPSQPWLRRGPRRASQCLTALVTLAAAVSASGCSSGPAGARTAAELFAARRDLTVGVSPKAAAVRDIDGDGKQDIIVVRATPGGSLTALLANGNSMYSRSELSSRIGDTPFDLVLQDLDGDGKLDAAAPCYLGGEVAVMWGGSFQNRLAMMTAGSHPYALLAVDLDGKNGLDLLATNQVGNSLNVYLNQGGQTFAAPVRYTFDAAPAGFAIGDFDGSGPGTQDVAIALPASDKVRLWPGAVGGTFNTGRATDLIVGKNPVGVVKGILNEDTWPDLVVANGGDNTVSVLFGSPSGFGSAVNYPVGANPTAVAVADLDADGHADIVVANRADDSISILRGTGGGQLISVGSLPVGEQPEGMTIDDLNQDGLPDIIVANVAVDTVTVYMGQAKQ